MAVQTGLLAVLLVRGHVPIFNDALLQELHLQAEHLGFETDDAHIVTIDSNGLRRRQLWSVKHEVKFTESDRVFMDVINDAWADFTNPKQFDPNIDAFVLATGYLAQKNKHLLLLLQTALASASAEDFQRRVARAGVVSNDSREYLEVLKRLCHRAAGRDIAFDELWTFLRSFHILSYDFDQTASQDEAQFKTLLALGIRSETGETGSDLWNAIFKWVTDLNPRAGSFTRESLPTEWQRATTSINPYFDSGVIQRLVEHSEDLLKRIQTTLGPTLHLERAELTETLALEKWMLDVAGQGIDLTSLARNILSRSNNVAISAVVASVAMAYPDSLGDVPLAFLRVREFFELDSHRFVADMSPVSSMLGSFGLNDLQRIHRAERVASDALPHRRRNLEWLTQQLQAGPLRGRVWTIIEDHKSRLPAAEKQKEADKLWRLRLHRIDLRNFTPTQELDDGKILYTPLPPDADIAEVIQKSQPRLKSNMEAIGLGTWADSVFEGSKPEVFDPGRWREMLNEAQKLETEQAKRQGADSWMYEGGPAYVAAVCTRDHWQELNAAEKEWCRELLLSRIMVDVTNDTERVQRFSRGGSRAAARVLPLLLDGADDSTRQRLYQGIAVGITHSVDEVREYTAMSIGSYLWDRDADLASACIAGLFDLSEAERRRYGRFRRRGFASSVNFRDSISTDIASIRARIRSAVPLQERRRYRLSIAETFSSHILPLVAAIISAQQARPLAQKLWTQIAESLAHSWKRYERYDRRRSHEVEASLKVQVSNFVVRCDPAVALRLWRPFSVSIPDHADEVAEIFHELIRAEDRVHEKSTFWTLWKETETRILAVSNVAELVSDERGDLTKLASALLLDIPWKEEAKEWEPLRAHESKIRDFVNKVGSAPPICRSFIRLLDSIGNFLLPDALGWLDDCLRIGDGAITLNDRDSLFRLSRILTPPVFGQTNILRKTPALRDAVLKILDAMVDQGSSSAFRMREFLITPAAPSNE